MNIKKCLNCEKQIPPRHRIFCSIKCKSEYYAKERGIHTGKCKCGCGKYWFSNSTTTKYIKGHDKVKIVVDKKFCRLCNNSLDRIYRWKMSHDELELCLSCYTVLFNMVLEKED